MAFQAGTQVDPRLLDYSGYARGITNAAAINAQALASLGQVVGEGIDKYNEKQQEKQQKKDATPVIASFLRQIDPSLSEEQSKAGATNFINSVGIEGVQAAIPLFSLEAMKSQNKIRLAQLEAFGELGKKDELSVTDQIKVSKEFEEDGTYYNQGFRIIDGQLFREVDPTPGKLGPGFRSDVQLVPVTEGPVFNVAEMSGVLAQTPSIDTSTIVGGAPTETETTTPIPDSLNIGVTESDVVVTPSLDAIQKVDTTVQRPQNYEFFDFVDYGEFEEDITSPMTKRQEGFPDIKASNRPLTYSEFTKAQIQRGKNQPRSRVAYVDKESVIDEQMAKSEYEKYLRRFRYDYPDTFEEYKDFGVTRGQRFEEDPQAFREEYLNYLESYQAPPVARRL